MSDSLYTILPQFFAPLAIFLILLGFQSIFFRKKVTSAQWYMVYLFITIPLLLIDGWLLLCISHALHQDMSISGVVFIPVLWVLYILTMISSIFLYSFSQYRKISWLIFSIVIIFLWSPSLTYSSRILSDLNIDWFIDAPELSRDMVDIGSVEVLQENGKNIGYKWSILPKKWSEQYFSNIHLVMGGWFDIYFQGHFHLHLNPECHWYVNCIKPEFLERKYKDGNVTSDLCLNTIDWLQDGKGMRDVLQLGNDNGRLFLESSQVSRLYLEDIKELAQAKSSMKTQFSGVFALSNPTFHRYESFDVDNLENPVNPWSIVYDVLQNYPICEH